MGKDRAIEYKSFEIEIKEISDTGSFEGYGAVFGNIDQGLDRIESGAFKKTLREKKTFPLLWQHDSTEPIGIFTAKQDDNGLLVKGELNLEVNRAREALSLLRQKAINGLSIGYSAIKHEYETIKNQTIRILKEIKLYETSIVTFPMNTLAQVTSVKELNNIFQQILENKDKDGFKEKILSLFEKQEPEVDSIPEIIKKPKKGLNFGYMVQKLNKENKYE